MKNNFLIILIIGLIVSASSYSQKILHLENDLVSADFNSENGALISYRNKLTGWDVIKRSELGQSFQMLIPLPERRYNNAYGINQKAPVVEQKTNALTFTWKGIVSDHLKELLPITFTGKVELNDKGLIFSGIVENNSQYDVEYVCWPYFGELSVSDKEDKLLWQTLHYGQDAQYEMYPYFSTHLANHGVDYPTQQGWLPEEAFILIRNSKEGFSVICDDHIPTQLVQCVFELVPGTTNGNIWYGLMPKEDNIDGQAVRVVFKANHITYTHPGEKTILTSVMLKPYKGSWHTGVEHYKEWRKTWHKSPEYPDWLKNVHSWIQIQINSAEDYLNFKYSDLVTYAKECKQYGVKAIQLTGWNIGGQDRNNPSHDTDPRLGTFEELKAAIAECEKMGVKIILFNKFTWADISSDWYRNDLKNYAVIDPYGDPYQHHGYQYHTYTQLLNINTRRFAPMCHLSVNWRKIADKEFTKSLDLGASGILYDENQHHGGAQMCFATNHGHKVPAYIFEGDDKLARGFTDIYKSRNKDFILFGEGNYDFQTQYYHGTYFRTYITTIPLHRYIDADMPIMVAIPGHVARHELNMCLKNKYIISYEPRFFKGWPHEAPNVFAYGKQIDDLRRKYKDFLWDDIYKDVLGATVNGENILYSVFERKTDNKRAVVVMNYSETDASNINVLLDGGGKVKYATPENTSIMNCDGSYVLQPRSAVVFFEQ